MAQNGKKVAKKYFKKFYSIVFEGALRILGDLFYSYKRIFSCQTDEYAHTVQWNNMASNVQTAAHFIQNLDIGLEVYYMKNGNAIYYRHM